MYFGARFAFNYLKTKYDYGTGTVEEEVKIFAVGPAVGVEHFLSSHFSIGGEFGFKYNMYRMEEDDDNINLFLTNGGLFVRFYF